jgi:hypothetical protein
MADATNAVHRLLRIDGWLSVGYEPGPILVRHTATPGHPGAGLESQTHHQIDITQNAPKGGRKSPGKAAIGNIKSMAASGVSR